MNVAPTKTPRTRTNLHREINHCPAATSSDHRQTCPGTQKSSQLMFSPEAAPTNIMLAEIFELGRLNDELIHLIRNIEFFVWFEVTSSELLSNTIQDFNCPGILHLGHLVSSVDVGHAA